MKISRRTVFVGAAATLVTPALAQIDDRVAARKRFEAEFNDLPLASKGVKPSAPTDVNTANLIVGSDYLRGSNPYDIMDKLRLLGTDNRSMFKSSTGHPWNERWPDQANPLLIRFFRDIGYHHTPYEGDCTPWCAATVSWCLQRAGYSLPADPASSQSFKSYGTPTSTPQHGDLCVFGDIGDPAHGHVGFYVETTGKTLKVMGGNQSGTGATTCGANFPRSKVGYADIAINAQRDAKIGYHYLIKYVRPVR